VYIFRRLLATYPLQGQRKMFICLGVKTTHRPHPQSTPPNPTDVSVSKRNLYSRFLLISFFRLNWERSHEHTEMVSSLQKLFSELLGFCFPSTKQTWYLNRKYKNWNLKIFLKMNTTRVY